MTSTNSKRWIVGVALLLAGAGGIAAGAYYLASPAVPPPAAAVPAGELMRAMEQPRDDALGLDAGVAERLGLQTVEVTRQRVVRNTRTTARVVADQRRQTRVQTRFEGWIEETFVNFEGHQVRKGEPLFTIYSPELLATGQEYLLALRSARESHGSEFEVVRGSGRALVESARRRLELLGVSSVQLAEIERTGEVPRLLTVTAPASGVVTSRSAFPGTRVTPEMELYALADLSVVWVEADVFETELADVHVGTHAEIELPDGSKRQAVASYINPTIDSETRTGQVRIELRNPRLELKPGMYLTVTFHGGGREALMVPRDAVLQTGTRALVLVNSGAAGYRLRTVRLGEQLGDAYTVLEGLAPGEHVARAIQFLIDSETALAEAVRRFPPSEQATTPAAHEYGT